MNKARKDSNAINYKAELKDRLSNSERWSSIWYEAYQNYRSKARVNAQYKEEQKLIIKEETEILELTTKITTLKSNIEFAKGKLAKGLEVMRDAEVQLDVQVEVQARHRQAVEDARLKAEEEAK